MSKNAAAGWDYFPPASGLTPTCWISMTASWSIPTRCAASNTRLRRTFPDCGHFCLRSEEHTSELQSPCNLVCRLLLEEKKIITHSPLVSACLIHTPHRV